jgi:phage virion morphogenesis protein
MGGASFNLNWGGLDRMVGSATVKAGRTHQAMAEIGEALASSTIARFDAGAGPDGTPWEPSQRAERESGKTLVDTGRLRGSIGYEASPSQVSVGSNLVYSRIHQLGGKAGRGRAVTLPARPYIGISEEDLQEARAILVEHFVDAFGGPR